MVASFCRPVNLSALDLNPFLISPRWTGPSYTMTRSRDAPRICVQNVPRRIRSAGSTFIGQHPTPQTFGPPEPGAQAFQLDDLTVVHEQVDLGSVVLDVPCKHFGV